MKKGKDKPGNPVCNVSSIRLQRLVMHGGEKAHSGRAANLKGFSGASWVAA